MSAKALTENQHLILHEYWPNNCCLCSKNDEIDALKQQIATLTALLVDAKRVTQRSKKV